MLQVDTHRMPFQELQNCWKEIVTKFDGDDVNTLDILGEGFKNASILNCHLTHLDALRCSKNKYLTNKRKIFSK